MESNWRSGEMDGLRTGKRKEERKEEGSKWGEQQEGVEKQELLSDDGVGQLRHT
jgi:hypothetical protein